MFFVFHQADQWFKALIPIALQNIPVCSACFFECVIETKNFGFEIGFVISVCYIEGIIFLSI